MTEILHTLRDAQICWWYFQKHVCKDAELIGAFGKGATSSKKDIDIHLPNFFPKGINVKMRAEKLRQKIKNLIEAESVELTDWGGWFFHNSIFGNVDVFFDISEFDY